MRYPTAAGLALAAWLVLAACTSEAGSKPAPLTIDELRDKRFDTSLEFVKDLDDGRGFTAYLVAYPSGGLHVHAMVAVPNSTRPANGYPVVVANHGHHPDPPKYGFTADGVDSRPGDYYRSVPGLFTSRGFLVVMPDFRGHNDSEGVEFTDGILESHYYTEDVAALLAALDDIDGADSDNVFMWGHSMGGEVTLRALLATDRVRGASLWSSVGGDIWDQSYYYSRHGNELEYDDSDTPKKTIEELREDIAMLDGDFDWRAGEPVYHLDKLRAPIAIHHAVGDRGAAYKWSERLAKELYMLGLPYRFYSYEGDAHFFDGQDRETAADRDAEFFRSLMIE